MQESPLYHKHRVYNKNAIAFLNATALAALFFVFSSTMRNITSNRHRGRRRVHDMILTEQLRTTRHKSNDDEAKREEGDEGCKNERFPAPTTSPTPEAVYKGQDGRE